MTHTEPQRRHLTRGLVHDLRQALRQLRIRPALSVLALALLALGVGAATTVFTAVYGMLLRPGPFPEPDALVHVWETRLDRGWNNASVTPANFRDLRELNRSFEELGAFRWTSLNLTGEGYPERLSGGVITTGFFGRLLRVPPALGRDFLEEEGRSTGAARVALLSHAFWQERFGGDATVLGRTLTLNGEPHTVVGVLPAGTPWLDAAQVFVPLVPGPEDSRGSFELAVVGRLKPGVTRAAAEADLERIAARLAELYPADDAGMGVRLEGAETWGADDGVRRALWVLLLGVGFLLLIACGNVTNLLLARATGRSRETAIRAALGASRGRLLRQGLIESLVLALTGGALGLALAAGALHALRALDPGVIPGLAYLRLDAAVLAFALAAALSTGVLTGLAPALQTWPFAVAASLRAGGQGSVGARGAKRLRTGLVAAEVALSLVLLVGAGLLTRSFGELLAVDPGFRTERRLVATVNLPDTYDAAQLEVFLRQFQERARLIPGVRQVGAISGRPLTGNFTSMGIVREDEPSPAGGTPRAQWRLVTPGYFETVGIPLRRGSLLGEREVIDPQGINRILISERLAELLWPGENPVGRRAIAWAGQDNIPVEVAGVVGDTHEEGLEAEPSLSVYVSYYGMPHPWSPTFVLHTAGDPLAIVPALRGALQELEPTLPFGRIRTLDEIVGLSLASRRLAVALTGSLALIAMLLAMAGVYGVQAYSVKRQTAEIGVRLALGAHHRRVLRGIVLRATAPALAGAVLGLATAFALSRLLTALLFQVRASDPLTYLGAAALLLGTALLAAWLPARAALRIDPATALRSE